ncbi:MAG: hypothetical protein CL609_22955 [Anaerolineaceae bacterium]|nr:hypothetical protein [Anaerolineaceae bacterium]
MISQKSNNTFLFQRNMIIALIARNFDLSIKKIVALTNDDYEKMLELVDSKESTKDFTKLIYDFYLSKKSYFPNSEFLFPTSEGDFFLPCDFLNQFRSLTLEVDSKEKNPHPKTLSLKNWEKIYELKFEKFRPQYQIILATGLCAFLGLRPSEVAELEKRDIDFSGQVIILRDTKSQKQQEIPVIPDLIEPLRLFVAYLPKNSSPLFVTRTGRKWGRREVNVAVKRYCEEINISDSVTPQRLRATLGKTLSDQGYPPSLIAKIMRHSDPATTIRHYTQTERGAVRKSLIEIHTNITNNSLADQI